uniref:Phosphate-regulating neutral endopeptidase (inferred by orthology to a human protein) n=1 Tax=Strongyloides venezuelensis TaxID=75913 RepID=A0A0K0FQ99_STRVS
MKFLWLLFNFCLLTILLVREGSSAGAGNRWSAENGLEDVSKGLKEYLDGNKYQCTENLDFYTFTCSKWAVNERKKERIIPDMAINYRNLMFQKFIKSTLNIKSINETKLIKDSFNIKTGNETTLSKENPNSKTSNEAGFLDEKMDIRVNKRSYLLEEFSVFYHECKEFKSKKEIFKCQQKVLKIGYPIYFSHFLKENRFSSEVTNKFKIVEEIAKNIREEFKRLIINRWFIKSNEADMMIEKIDKMKFRYGYSYKALFNDIQIEECYDDLLLNSTTGYKRTALEVIGNYTYLAETITKNVPRECKFIYEDDEMPVDPFDLLFSRYVPEINEFVIHHHVLNEPKFSTKYPESMNYGGVGFEIGRQIAMAFIGNNTFFDHKGIIASEMFSTKFKHQQEVSTSCFMRKYGEEFSKGEYYRNLRSYPQLDSDIADAIGLKVAHLAYMRHLRSVNGKEPKIPGFENLSGEELFFISFGRGLCEDKSKYDTFFQLKDHTISSSSKRSIGALYNYKPFIHAFGCKVMDPMMIAYECDPL